RISDVPIKLAAPHPHWRRKQLRRHDEATCEQFPPQEDPQPISAAHQGQPVEDCLLHSAVAPVWLRQYIRTTALTDVNLRGRIGVFGSEVDRAGAGADDGNALMRQVDTVVPSRGVPRWSSELSATHDVGDRWPAELANGRDDRCRSNELAVVELELPH